MKKLILILLCVLLYSCSKLSRIEPIEKYRGKGIIVLEKPNPIHFYPTFAVKNKDSVFRIQIPQFDAKDLKPGDTL